MPPTIRFVAVLLGCTAAFVLHAAAATLEVGPGMPFSRIEDANQAARPGDVVLVHPRAEGRPYEKVAVFVTQPRVTFRAIPAMGQHWVTISGKGFDYSGRGRIPRAIFQFNRGADGCVLEGFELTEAHNGTHNGAGVRINQANHVTVRHCRIHHNDMGIMSNGDGTPDRGVNQRIEHCLLHHNGSFEDPGYNHNLYLGGTSVALRFCEVHHSLTGHNVKSRAHHTRVEYCYVHDSANREFDLVDAADTERVDSHAVILGCVIVKDPTSKGNKAVLHFGQDGGREHDGTVTLAFNTIVTPFVTPVIELSAPKAQAHLVGNLVTDGGRRQANQQILRVRNGAQQKHVTGNSNVFSGGFSPVPATALDANSTTFRRLDTPLFVAPEKHNYQLRSEARQQRVLHAEQPTREIPAFPGDDRDTFAEPLKWQYVHAAGKEPRHREQWLTVGAY